MVFHYRQKFIKDFDFAANANGSSTSTGKKSPAPVEQVVPPVHDGEEDSLHFLSLSSNLTPLPLQPATCYYLFSCVFLTFVGGYVFPVVILNWRSGRSGKRADTSGATSSSTGGAPQIVNQANCAKGSGLPEVKNLLSSGTKRTFQDPVWQNFLSFRTLLAKVTGLICVLAAGLP
ncbi:unnamed protein product, partial [Amoebophrya sp. A120]